MNLMLFYLGITTQMYLVVLPTRTVVEETDPRGGSKDKSGRSSRRGSMPLAVTIRGIRGKYEIKDRFSRFSPSDPAPVLCPGSSEMEI